MTTAIGVVMTSHIVAGRLENQRLTGKPLRYPGGSESTVSARRARTDRVERRRHHWKPAVGRVCRREADALDYGPLR